MMETALFKAFKKAQAAFELPSLRSATARPTRAAARVGHFSQRRKAGPLLAQAASEFLTIFAVVLLLTLVVISLIASQSSSATGLNQSESHVYWRSTARPVQVQDGGSVFGTLCSQANKGGYELLIKNADPSELTVTGITLNGQPRSFCENNGAAQATVDLNPYGQKVVGIITGDSAPCAFGEYVYLNLTFSYSRDSISNDQHGRRQYILVCANGVPGQFYNTTLPGSGTSTNGTLTILTTSLPAGAVDAPYSQELTASGGNASAYYWSIVNGALPSGLTLSQSSGIISGTPTTPQTSSFTVRLSDGDQVATKALSITINPSAITILTDFLPNGTVGTAYSTTLSATGGTGSYTWSIVSGSLPAGLSLANSTGAINGTPSQNGTYQIGFNVTDGYTRASKAFNMTIYSNNSSSSCVCGVISTPNRVCTLTQNLSSSGTCFTITANNVTISCAGYTINGSNATGSYAVHSASQNNTTVQNCMISNYQHGAYLGGAGARVSNSTISSTHSSGNAIFLSSCSRCSIAGNELSGAAGALRLSLTSNSTFSQNTLQESSAASGILRIEGSSNNYFEGNTNCIDCTNSTLGFYSDSGQNISSNGNTGWWPLLGANGSSATTGAQTAFYNGSAGGRNYDWGISAQNRYWYNNSTCECGTLSTANTVCTLTGNLSASGACFTVSAANVTIDCNGYGLIGLDSGMGIIGITSLQGMGNNTTVKNCAISGFGTGIEFDGSSGLILNSSIHDNAYTGVYLGGGYATVSNTSIYNNSGYGGLLSLGVMNNLSGNRIFNNIGSDIVGWGLNYCNDTVANTNGSGGNPIRYFARTPATLSNTIVSELLLCDADGSVITNVTVNAANGTRDKYNNPIYNNGIFLIATDNARIANSASVRNAYGASLYSSAGNNITGNTFTSSSTGLGLDASSTGNSISSNSLDNTSTYGIYLQTSSGSNTISHNTLSVSPSASSASRSIHVSSTSANNYFENNSNCIACNNSYQRFYSSSAQNISSSGNTGWWPLLAHDGSSATTGAQTAFYNGTGGRNWGWTANTSLTYWYSTGPAGCGVYSTPNTAVTLTGNLSSSGTCITITANNVSVNCNGYTVNGTSLSGYGIYSTASNTLIENCTIRNYASGILFSSASSGTIRNNTLQSNMNGIQFISTSATNVTNNTAAGNYYGIYLSSSSQNNVSGNSLINNSRFDFYIQASTSSHCDNTVLANAGSGGRNINYYGNAPASLSSGTYSELALCNADSSNINGVTVLGAGGTIKNNGILLVNTGFSNVTNSIASSTYNSIELSGSSNNNISGNTLTSVSGASLSATSSSNNLVANNSMSCSINCILSMYSNNNSYIGNTVSNPLVWLQSGAIYLMGSSNNYFENNVNCITCLPTSQRFYSDSAQNTSSKGNTGWWPLLTSDGTGATSDSGTAFYNITGGTTAGWNMYIYTTSWAFGGWNGTNVSSLHYWYGNQS